MSAEPRHSRDFPRPPPVALGRDESVAPATVPLADASAPLPEDPAEQAFSLLLSGELKFRQRNLLEAESYLRRAVELHARLPDADPAERLRALDALGAVYAARGDLARAEPVLREALGRADALLGDEHDDLGPYLNQLAHVLFKRKRYAEAEPVLARLVAIKRRMGDEHPEVASVVANLALVHEALQRYDSAETLWRCALVIREQSLPDDSPAVSMAREHLADMCATNGRPEEAIALRELALAARAQTLPSDHPQLASARAKLTALKLDGVRARIPVVVPQARTTERFDAALSPQPIPRPPSRGAPSRPASKTPPIPRDVLDEIVRATSVTPTQGVMAGMRGRARQLFERPLLKLVKPRSDAPPDDPAFDDDEDLVAPPASARTTDRKPPPASARPTDRPAPTASARPADRTEPPASTRAAQASPPSAPRPVPRVIIPRSADVRAAIADAAPATWEDEDRDDDGDSPYDEDGDAPRSSRFDVFSDALWPKTRIVLAVLALTLLLAVGAAAVARIAGGASPDQVAEASPPAAAETQPAPVTDPAVVPDETRRVMDAGLRALERATETQGVSRPRPVSTSP
jgi:tetratricopeptide (TPR) repeat protein